MGVDILHGVVSTARHVRTQVWSRPDVATRQLAGAFAAAVAVGPAIALTHVVCAGLVRDGQSDAAFCGQC